MNCRIMLTYGAMPVTVATITWFVTPARRVKRPLAFGRIVSISPTWWAYKSGVRCPPCSGNTYSTNNSIWGS